MSISHLRVEEPLSKERPIPVQGKYLIAQEGRTQFSAGKNLGIEKLNELGTYLKDSLNLWDRFLNLVGYRNWQPITVRDSIKDDLRIVYFDVKILQKVQEVVYREFKRLVGKGVMTDKLEREALSLQIDPTSFSRHSAPNLYPLLCDLHKQMGVFQGLLNRERRREENDALLLRYEKHLRSGSKIQSTTASSENLVQEGQGTKSRVSPVNFSDEGR